MFYATGTPHGLSHNPFKALVAPRPIGWISTLNPDGTANLAPYSFFNAISDDMVMFSSVGLKDSARNAIQSGEFICNYASADLLHQMNASSAGLPHGTDEFEIAGLTKHASKTVSAPRIEGTPAALECKTVEAKPIVDSTGRDTNTIMVIGHVTGVFIDDAYISEGRFDVAKAAPVTRLGYMDYAHLGDVFELNRP